MAAEDHYRRLERMYATAPVNAFYSPTLAVREGEAELRIPIRKGHHHAAGAVHGSVIFKALDDSAFFAANSLVEDVFVLTVTFSLHFLRPVTDGELRATGRVVHRSRRLIVAESVVVDSRGREVARGTGTFMRSASPLSAEIGYA